MPGNCWIVLYNSFSESVRINYQLNFAFVFCSLCFLRAAQRCCCCGCLFYGDVMLKWCHPHAKYGHVYRSWIFSLCTHLYNAHTDQPQFHTRYTPNEKKRRMIVYLFGSLYRTARISSDFSGSCLVMQSDLTVFIRENWDSLNSVHFRNEEIGTKRKSIHMDSLHNKRYLFLSINSSYAQIDKENQHIFAIL